MNVLESRVVLFQAYLWCYSLQLNVLELMIRKKTVISDHIKYQLRVHKI